MLTGLLSHRQRVVQLVLILIGILALVLWLRSFDLAGSLRYLRGANPGWVLAFILVHMAVLALRSFRCRSVISPLCPLPVRTVGEIYFLGEFVNSSFAMRSGDVAKAAMLRQAGGLPVMSGLSLLFADKIFELWGLISVPGLGLVLLIAARESVGGISIPVLAVYPILMRSMLIVLRIIAIDWAESKILPVSRRPGLLGRIGTIIHHVAVGLRAAAQMPSRQLVGLALLSSFVFLVDGLSVVLLFWAIGADVSIGKVLLASCMLALIFVLPAPPAYVGTLEGGFAVFFTQLHVVNAPIGQEAEIVAAAAILFHAALYLSVLALAALSFRRYRAMLRARHVAETEGALSQPVPSDGIPTPSPSTEFRVPGPSSATPDPELPAGTGVLSPMTPSPGISPTTRTSDPGSANRQSNSRNPEPGTRNLP